MSATASSVASLVAAFLLVAVDTKTLSSSVTGCFVCKTPKTLSSLAPHIIGESRVSGINITARYWGLFPAFSPHEGARKSTDFTGSSSSMAESYFLSNKARLDNPVLFPANTTFATLPLAQSSLPWRRLPREAIEY